MGAKFVQVVVNTFVYTYSECNVDSVKVFDMMYSVVYEKT